MDIRIWCKHCFVYIPSFHLHFVTYTHVHSLGSYFSFYMVSYATS
jgi:hypothetical protein